MHFLRSWGRLAAFCGVLAAANVALADDPTAFLQRHCVRCHGADEPEGGVRLDDLTFFAEKAPSERAAAERVSSERRPAEKAQGERWAAVRNQLRDGLMPPPDEPQPPAAEVRRSIAAIAARIGTPVARGPNQGNLLPHELLFGPAGNGSAEQPPAGPGASSPRIWRLRPAAYESLLRGVLRSNPTGITAPFGLDDERGFRDYAELYRLDEPSTEVLLRNARVVVDLQTEPELLVPGKKVPGATESPPPERRKNQAAIPELVRLVDPAAEPSRDRLAEGVALQYRLALGRSPSSEETARFLALYDRCAANGDRAGAVKTMLQAVLLSCEATFRFETGQGAADGAGRRRLGPLELARALSLALGERVDAGLKQAAEQGKLAAPEQVAAEVRRMIADPKRDTSRIEAFFREYFEYHRAVDVFKDKPRDLQFHPAVHVRDTELLIRHIVRADRDVFRTLLTTPLTYANIRYLENKQTRTHDVPSRAEPPPRVDKRTKTAPLPIEGVYGFAEWPAQQPAEVPGGTRIGILMQPSWLIAWSTNFDNDPVRRGRWVRERLLGGTVPDLPIGVDARVPDDPHRTFRERLSVTKAASCLKCHRRMDDLGLPFENFDHFGRLRTAEPVLDVAATAQHVDAKGKPLGPVLRDATLDTSGRIADSGDPQLDGPVRDPREMLRRIAASERARQVFVRHAFRFFFGRNESLADAATLRAADAAYVAEGGSFAALVASLLSSDPFLYRTLPESRTAAGDSP